MRTMISSVIESATRPLTRSELWSVLEMQTQLVVAGGMRWAFTALAIDGGGRLCWVLGVEGSSGGIVHGCLVVML